MKDFTYITNSSPAFIESLYRDFVKDPDSIDPEMRKFFEGFDFAFANAVNGNKKNGNGVSELTAPGKTETEKEEIKSDVAEVPVLDANDWIRELSAYRLILGYRNKGHLVAKTNPIRTRKDR